MEDFPEQYVNVTRPLVVLLGLQDETANSNLPKPLNNGTVVNADGPALTLGRRAAIRQAVKRYGSYLLDERGEVEQQALPSQTLIFHFKESNKRYVFPSRKASPPPSQVSPIGSSGANAQSPTLHSPLSPLSPGSPTFPDGVMTSIWFMKYQEALPAVLISFFEIAHDINEDVLNDNRLKNDIGTFQTALYDANYKGKHMVVLAGNHTLVEEGNIDTRLSNIRKAAKLDNKTTFFYLPPNTSTADLDAFAEAITQAARSFCLDFYKNLHKHARRKKDRKSSSLPTTPSSEHPSQHLLHAGWNTRYALKMGFFSEIRFEMDAASRSYGEAIDHLMEPGGVFDQTSSFSPRFNDARLLADSLAARRIRCLLADGHTSAAARFWSTYHDRTCDLVERLGKGSETYGWPCWEARWARTMAQLLHNISSLASDSNARKALEPLQARRKLSYAMADRRNRLTENGSPWTAEIHHPGYWYALSAKYQSARAAFASEIPEEDRNPPGQSPATSVARVHREYESYLCPEPHVEATEVDHAGLIAQDLQSAREEYRLRGHTHSDLVSGIAMAEVISKKASGEALVVLRTLREYLVVAGRGWTTLSERLAFKAYEAATAQNDTETSIVSMWELLHSNFDSKEGLSYDLMQRVDDAEHKQQQQESKQTLTIEHGSVTSFVSAQVCFESPSVSAGERVRFQVIVRSAARRDTPPVNFTELELDFQGSPNVVIEANDDPERVEKSGIQEVVLREPEEDTPDDARLTGSASLSIHPGQTRVFVFSLLVREPKQVRAREVAISIQRQNLGVRYVKDLTDPSEAFRWWSTRENFGLVRHRQRWDAGSIEVLPKQPKMMLHIPNLRPTYYTGERAILNIDMVNEESDEVDAELEIWLVGAQESGERLKFHDEDVGKGFKAPTNDSAIRRNVGSMAHASTVTTAVAVSLPSMRADLSLEVEVRYHSVDDPQSQTSKTSSTKLNLVDPFDASFTLEPLLHPEPWPSYFDHEAPGLDMRWRLHLQLHSQAADEIVVSGTEMELIKVGDGAQCSLSQPATEESRLAPANTTEAAFILDIKKVDLDDARPAAIDASVKLTWLRAESTPEETIKTYIPTPRLNLPTNEPRALATRGDADEDGSIPVTITLENPSMHYLSFELTLEPTDDFVLSGPTRKNINLIPLSRHAVDFTILPMVENTHVRPHFKVVDTYFNKLLHIHPGDGLSADEAGGMLMWVGEAG